MKQVMHWLQHSRLRKTVLRLLLRLDNVLRRWIVFFSLEQGLHPKHRITKYHEFFLDQVRPSDTVLDVGCGIGALAFDVAQRARQVVGIDLDAERLALAQRQWRAPNLTYVLGDATRYDFKAHFDVIILSNVLEHIADRAVFLMRLGETADRLLIRVPMIDRDWLPPLKQELGVEYRLDPTHYIEYTEAVFRREIQEAQLSVASLTVRFGEIYSVVQSARR